MRAHKMKYLIKKLSVVCLILTFILFTTSCATTNYNAPQVLQKEGSGNMMNTNINNPPSAWHSLIWGGVVIFIAGVVYSMNRDTIIIK